MAKEHKSVTEKLAVDFDPTAAKKLGRLTSIASALKEWEKAKEVDSPSATIFYTCH